MQLILLKYLECYVGLHYPRIDITTLVVLPHFLWDVTKTLNIFIVHFVHIIFRYLLTSTFTIICFNNLFYYCYYFLFGYQLNYIFRHVMVCFAWLTCFQLIWVWSTLWNIVIRTGYQLGSISKCTLKINYASRWPVLLNPTKFFIKPRCYGILLEIFSKTNDNANLNERGYNILTFKLTLRNLWL